MDTSSKGGTANCNKNKIPDVDPQTIPPYSNSTAAGL